MFAFIRPVTAIFGCSHLISSRRLFTRGLLPRFGQDRRGSVAIMFGLTIFIVFTLVGAAVDYGRTLLARERLQATVDSAVLAAARVWQTEQDMDLAEEKAIAHFEAMKPEGVDAKLTTLAPDMDMNTLTAEASAEVRVPFLSLVLDGKPLKVAARAQAKFCVGCSTANGGGGGGNDGYDIEVAMMLDITGSMAGSKIEDLRDAAKDLIKIVVADDQSRQKSRVALVPFSQAVNAGSVLGPAVAYDPSSNLKFDFRDGKERKWYRTSAYCVSERQGTNAYTDVTPTGSNRLPRAYFSSSNASSCQPAAAVVPLSSNKTSLIAAIDDNTKFKAEGYTAGNLGTAWAWYMLSPNWWSGIDASIHSSARPAAYPDLPGECSSWATCSQQDRAGIPVMKYAVLMTDGEYNMQYCNGSVNNTAGASIPDRNTDVSNSAKANCSSPLGSSNTQALALCTAMKNAGIIVYTVGFGLGTRGTQVDMLRNCASSDGHFSNPGKLFYNTQTGAELRSAFRHIATSIATIYVSQ
ncbi:MAG TPA: TadE/TadG family type IV pilus assembly protein [Hyphomicrobiaceae bacterium]|nr:TadE/TadG family type IV pilus assembly protein [Hyphomicrobiaceae bacterium]